MNWIKEKEFGCIRISESGLVYTDIQENSPDIIGDIHYVQDLNVYLYKPKSDIRLDAHELKCIHFILSNLNQEANG